MPRIRFKLWHLFLLTTTAAIAIALFAIYRQHQLFPFSDVQEAAEHFNSDGRWTLVEIHGDTNGPYDWTGGGSFNNDIQKSMSYTINSDHKTHNFQLSTHNRNRGESVRYSRFTNPQDNDLLLIFVSNHDRIVPHNKSWAQGPASPGHLRCFCTILTFPYNECVI